MHLPSVQFGLCCLAVVASATLATNAPPKPTIAPTGVPQPVAIQEWEKKAIIDVLNQARGTTVLPASNMKMLEWDEDLAKLAQAYTNGCKCVGRRYSNAFHAWCDEMPDPVSVAKWRTLRMAPYYDYETGDCIDTPKSQEICRHPANYEAMIYASSERVGCAMTRCWPNAGRKALFHTCVVNGQRPRTRGKPFKVGPRCSECNVEQGWKYCVDGLCSKVPPTDKPSKAPTSSKPTRSPTKFPTKKPTNFPTPRPTQKPTKYPTRRPTKTPTAKPTRQPTKFPSKRPTNQPTRYPTRAPTTAYPTTKFPTKKQG